MTVTRFLLAAALTLTATALPAQTTQRFTASKATEYGLVYSLPLTAVDITIETEHTCRVPGEFHNYARRHLAIGNAITAESTTATVKSVTIATRGIGNPDSRWLVQFKAGATPFMILSGESTPLAINTDNVAETDTPQLPVAQPRRPTILESDAARQAMTEDMIRSSSVSKRAELAAQRIFELRDVRSDLLSGQADNPPADGQAMQLVLQNLADQEEALTAMFAGTTSVWTDVKTITIVPDSLETSDEVLSRVSPFDGIIGADNLAGAPIRVSVEIIERGELPVNDKGEVKKFPKGGVAYTIAGTARISVSYEGRVIGSADVALAQLGCTFGLDPSLFTDKKAPSQLLFDPATGGILLLGPAE